MKTVDALSIGVATFVLGGIVGAGIMKGVITVQLKNGLEDFKKDFKSELERELEGDREERLKRRSTYSNYYGRTKKQDPEKPSDVIFDNGKEAMKVLQEMDDIIENYGMVTVGDFYQLSGIDGRYTDESIGWTNIDDTTTRDNKCGVSLNLPEPIKLKGEK